MIDARAGFPRRGFMTWAAARDMRHLLNQAGCPMRNATIESFNGSFRDECLDEQWFRALLRSQ
jgi:putative transposase